VLSGTAFGTVPIAGRLAYDHGAGALTLLAGRYVLAATALGLALLVVRSARPSRAVPWGGILVAGLATTAANAGYLGAVALDDVTRVAPLVFLFPLLVPLVAAAAGREPLRAAVLLAAAVGVAGSILAVGSGFALPVDATAATLALLSAAANVVFILFVASALRGTGWILVAAGMFLVAAAVMAPAAALTGSALPDATGWGWIAVIGLLCTAAPYGLWLAGLRLAGESRTAALAVWEPAVSVLLALVVLDEGLTAIQAAGIGLVLASLALAGARARRV